MVFDRELEAFRRALPQLMDQAGRFALIHQDQIVGTFTTYAGALEAGYSRFILSRFW